MSDRTLKVMIAKAGDNVMLSMTKSVDAPAGEVETPFVEQEFPDVRAAMEYAEAEAERFGLSVMRVAGSL